MRASNTSKILIVAGLLGSFLNARASVIQVAPGDVTPNDIVNCSLIDAINAANMSTVTNTTVGACTPTGTPNGGGEGYSTGNVIVLAPGAYTLTQADNYWYGPNGLPAITSSIIMVGDPVGSIIARSNNNTVPDFRFFYVGGGESLSGYNPPPGLTNLPGPGSLTLVNLTLEDGVMQGGIGFNNGLLDGGGGGGAFGGAIYNQGDLSLIGVTLTGNQASGGSGGPTMGAPGGGGGLGSFSNGLNGGGFDPSGLWPDGSATYGSFGNGGAADSNGGVGGGGGVSGLGGYGGGAGAGADGSGGGCFGGGDPGCGFGGGGVFNRYGGGAAGLGGAIFNEGGTVSVLNSTLTGNTAQGGAGYHDFTDNTGSSGGSGYGGAIFNLNGTITIRYSTLGANTALPGSGISYGFAAGDDVYNLYYASPGSPAADAGSAAVLVVNSTILAGPLTGSSTISDCENDSATFTSGHDVVQTVGNCTFTNNDQIGNPGLAALANNGGPTETMALNNGSIAIDMGDTGTSLGAPPVTDQRGFYRDKKPDVGAYEYAASPVGVAGPANVSIMEGDSVPVQDFTLRDSNQSPITVTTTSSNTPLLPASGITVSSGCGSDVNHYNCTLTLTPIANQTGSTTINISANDGKGHSAQSSFVFTINPVSNSGGGSGGGGGALGVFGLLLLMFAYRASVTRLHQ
jgi:hypothetical protein